MQDGGARGDSSGGVHGGRGRAGSPEDLLLEMEVTSSELQIELAEAEAKGAESLLSAHLKESQTTELQSKLTEAETKAAELRTKLMEAEAKVAEHITSDSPLGGAGASAGNGDADGSGDGNGGNGSGGKGGVPGTQKSAGKGKNNPPPPPPDPKAKGKGKGKKTEPPPDAPVDKGKGKKGKPGPPPTPKAKGAEKSQGKGKAEGKDAPSPEEPPRKPEVIPAVQVKRIFWNPIRLRSAMTDTVWDEIDREGADVDTESLQAMFADANGLRSMARSDSDPVQAETTKVKVVRVLDEARRRQVSVMLGRLHHMSRAELLSSMQAMDSTRLSRDEVELLLQNCPSSDELQTMKRAQEETLIDELNIWDKPEEFVLGMMAIPRVSLRLKVWDFLNSFQERLEMVSVSVRAVSRASHCLRSSSKMRHLLGIALSAGNFLNGGTPRGRADGFAIEALTQLRTVKASRIEGQTLVHYITQQMEQRYPAELDAILGAGQDAETIDQAGRAKLGELEQESTALLSQGRQMLVSIRLVCKEVDATPDDGCETDVLQQHREGICFCVAEVEALCQRVAEASQSYSCLCSWFHMDAESSLRKASDEFFVIWQTFLQDVKKAKHALREKEQQEIRRQRSRSRQPSASVQRKRQSDPSPAPPEAADVLGLRRALSRGASGRVSTPELSTPPSHAVSPEADDVPRVRRTSSHGASGRVSMPELSAPPSNAVIFESQPKEATPVVTATARAPPETLDEDPEDDTNPARDRSVSARESSGRRSSARRESLMKLFTRERARSNGVTELSLQIPSVVRSRSASRTDDTDDSDSDSEDDDKDAASDRVKRGVEQVPSEDETY